MITKRGSNLGGFCGRGTPVPIPNTEVKTASADGTRKGRVGRRQDLHLFYKDKKTRLMPCFLFVLYFQFNSYRAMI